MPFPTPTPITPNAQQQDVLDWSDQSITQHLNLNAYAGTGKTATLIQLCHHLAPSQARVFLGAFNKSIADELQSRLPNRPGFTASTLHSAGLRAWKSQCRFVEVDGDKVRQIARNSWAVDAKTASAASTIVGYMKGAGLGIDHPYEDLDKWEEIISHYDLEDDIPATMRREAFLQNCIDTYERSLEWCRGQGAPYGKPTLDFNDMLLAPLYFRVPLPQYEWAMLDEAQDTSMLRRKIVQGMVTNGGRLIAVGDKFQAIYGFAGANNDALDIIKSEMGSAELPLNVTYRCPRSVVEFAQQWVPDYQAHPSAPTGTIRNVYHTDFWMERFNPRTDVILCRLTRPLVGIAIALRNRNIPCVVEGQSAKSYIALAVKWGDLPLPQYVELLDDYEKEQLKAFDRTDDQEKKARLMDRVGAVRDMARGLGQSKTTRDLSQYIEMVFREQGGNPNVLRLCTIHRAKGREWERVFLVGREQYQPGWWAEQEWEMQQERNLEYVAVTRTKNELVEVEVPGREEEREMGRRWWELE